MTDVELVKSKIDIVSFLSEYMTLKKAGRNFKALCPFHSEKTPSFIVSPERQSWHCFGGCAMGGDAISFLQKWENLEFLEALRLLAGRVGVTLSNYAPTETTKLKDKLFEINHMASEFYHYLLASHKVGSRAKDYLLSRNIKPQTIKTFMLGYAPAGWDNLLRYLTKKGYCAEDIYTAGLIVKSDRGRFYDRFRGRLVFTLCDPRGNIIGFSGRLLDEEVHREGERGVYPERERGVYPERERGVYPERERGAKYVNTPETPVYIKGNTLYGLNITKEAIKFEKEAVLVEGEFDMLSSFQSGVANVAAIKGSALTEGQLLLLKRYTENLILGFDSDFAGNEAAKRGIESADMAGFNLKVVKLPFGKDPAECIGKDPHLWKKAVGESVPIYDFIIETAFSKYDKNDISGKKKIGAEAIPFLQKIVNPIVASHYIKYLANNLGVTEESIEMAMAQFQKNSTVNRSTYISVSKQSGDTYLEEYFFSLIIQSHEPSSYLTKAMSILSSEDFNEPPVSTIIGQLILYFKTHKQFDIKIFGKLLTPEVIPTFDRAYLRDISHVHTNIHDFDKEVDYVTKKLRVISIRRRINNLSTKLRLAEKEGKNEEAKSHNEELRKLLKEIDKLDKSG